MDGCSAEMKGGGGSVTACSIVCMCFKLKSLTLVLQSLTVQSKEEEMKRWEKSMGPPALWQLSPVTGP